MKSYPVLILIALAVSLSIIVLPVKGQEDFLNLTIKPDGTVEPDTSLLERNDDVYTFTGDIYGCITVQKSGVTIDGAGFTLQGRGLVNERGVYLVGPDQSHPTCIKSVVKNLKICNFFEGIFLIGSSNSSITGNFFESAGIHFIGYLELAGDLVNRNTFKNSTIFVDYNSAGKENITQNNFVDSTIFVDLSNPPIVDRNYWSNYTQEYPNAKEIGTSGIWDTPNDYDKFINGSHGKDPCLDNHPLVNPIVNTEIEAFNVPAATPTPTISPIQNPVNPALNPALLGLAVVTISGAFLAVVLILKRKNKRIE